MLLRRTASVTFQRGKRQAFSLLWAHHDVKLFRPASDDARLGYARQAVEAWSDLVVGQVVQLGDGVPGRLSTPSCAPNLRASSSD
jgi:hypothetical protein